MSAFVLLSPAYHRSKFISLRQLSDRGGGGGGGGNEPLDLGTVLLESFAFVFGDDPPGSDRGHADPNLEDQIQKMQAWLTSARIQAETMADENQRLKAQAQQALTRTAAVSDLIAPDHDDRRRPYVAAWHRADGAGRRPSPRYRHAAAFDPDRSLLIVYGGLGDDRQLDDVWRLDVQRWVWDRPPVAGRVPDARHGHAVAIAGDRLVVFGGLVGRFRTDQTLVLDIAIWTWGAKAAMATDGLRPAPRDGASMAPYGRVAVLLFGGRDRERLFHDLWRFSVDERIWTPLAVLGRYPTPSPSPPSLFGRLHDHVYVVAGQDDGAALVECVAPDAVVWKRFGRGGGGPRCDALVRLGAVLAGEPFLVVDKPPELGERIESGLSSFRMALWRIGSESEEVAVENVGPDHAVLAPGARTGATLIAVSETRAILFGGYRDGKLLDELWVLEIAAPALI